MRPSRPPDRPGDLPQLKASVNTAVKKTIHTLYHNYIRPADPGFFITRYAAKAAFSCLVAFGVAVLLGLEGKQMFWFMAGSVCTVLFRTGSTLKRRKGYGLLLLCLAALIAPFAAVIGGSLYLSLGFIFFLSLACFFIASLGISATTIGNACMVISLVSIFSPAGTGDGVMRGVMLLSGGLISFTVHFYLRPIDPEKIIFSAARLALEDMNFLLEGICIRVKNPKVSEGQIAFLNTEASRSIRRYRTFMESFNIDPLRGAGASGGPGLFYFALIRMFESIVTLFHHIHFSDHRPEFDDFREEFYHTAFHISHAVDRFSKMERKTGRKKSVSASPLQQPPHDGTPLSEHDAPVFFQPDFEEMIQRITRLQNALFEMGGYQKGDAVQEKFLEAWGAVYALKNVTTEFERLVNIAREKFKLSLMPPAPPLPADRGQGNRYLKTLAGLKPELRPSSPVFRHALRAAVAITVAIAAARGLAMEHAAWIPISVIVVMRPSLGGTLIMSRRRLTGTILGAASAVVILLMHPTTPMVGVMVCLLLFLMLYFKAKHYMTFVGILTGCVVLILGTVFSHTWQGGIERIFDTLLGISIGLGASLLIWPTFARKHLRKEMGDLIRAQHRHFKQLREACFSETPDSAALLSGRITASNQLAACTEKFMDAAAEPGLRTVQRHELLNLIDIFTRIHRTLTALSSIVNHPTGIFQDTARPQFETLMDAVETEFSRLLSYAETGTLPRQTEPFSTTVNRFMACMGTLREQGAFEDFTLDSRNNASSFIQQVNRLGMDLIRAGNGIKALRHPDRHPD